MVQLCARHRAGPGVMKRVHHQPKVCVTVLEKSEGRQERLRGATGAPAQVKPSFLICFGF